MPSVSLNRGTYWVGNPKTVFPDWTPSESCVYRESHYTYFAFCYNGTYVAAVPVEALAGKEIPLGTVTFSGPTLFYEQDGTGYIGDILLGTLGEDNVEPVHDPVLEELKEEALSVLPHVSNTDSSVDFPKKKKPTKSDTV